MQRTGEQKGKALGRVAGIPEPTGPQGSLKTQHLSKQGSSVSLPGHLNGLSKEKLQTLHQSENTWRMDTQNPFSARKRLNFSFPGTTRPFLAKHIFL